MWDEQERSLAVELSKQLDTAAEIANELANYGYKKRSPSAIRGCLRRWKNKHQTQTEQIQNIQTEDKYTATLKRMRHIRDETLKGSVKYSNKRNGCTNGTRKILSISDTHIPFFNGDVVKHAIDNHSDASAIVLAGDILEVYSVSKWPKNKSVLLRHEYEIASIWIRKLSTIFPEVFLVRGNHEGRLQKYFSSNLDPVVSFLTEPDILTRLADGYAIDDNGTLTKKYDLPNVHYRKGLTSWFCQIGQVIYVHPDKASGTPMRTAEKAAIWFLERNFEFEAIVVGHSHRLGQIIWNDRLLIEQGCACTPLEYSYEANMNYKPQTYGYSVVYIDNDGHVDFNRSQAVYCGTGAITPCNSYKGII